jgi:hypothetical protein
MFAHVLLPLAGAASALSMGVYAPYDVSDPVSRLRLEMAISCKASQDVNDPIVTGWSGKVMSRREGEPDQHLFDVQGINPRACQIFDDPVRGPGYRAVARELMIFIDPRTGKVLDSWKNPWTGETVDVVHMLNDPASMAAPVYAFNADGTPAPVQRPWQDWGESFIQFDTRGRFSENPMGGAYQQWVGGQYQAMESTALRVHKSHIAAIKAGKNVPAAASLVRLSKWLPWMKMGSREGVIVTAWQGRTFASYDDLPEPLRGLVNTRWPQMKSVPAFDDDRPFVNSWGSMKNHFDAQAKPSPDNK